MANEYITSETGAIDAAKKKAASANADGDGLTAGDLQDAIAAVIGATGNGDGKGSGSGTPKPPPDPYAPVIRSFFSAYFKLWGTLPPPGYVEKAARSMNLYEFIARERKKPAFRETKAYKTDAAKFAALRDQLLGYY